MATEIGVMYRVIKQSLLR